MLVATAGVPDDVEHGVAVRMQRQQFLYRGVRRLNAILGEHALYANLATVYPQGTVGPSAGHNVIAGP
jgi:hypothetical protein